MVWQEGRLNDYFYLGVFGIGFTEGTMKHIFLSFFILFVVMLMRTIEYKRFILPKPQSATCRNLSLQCEADQAQGKLVWEDSLETDGW